MKKIAIIPARGGSKRIPKKNSKVFLGKPIIAYSIEEALSSELFDEVMVSTDDAEIAALAIKYGAKVPFLRSEKNSDDFASTVDVLLEVIEEYRNQGFEFDYGCCLYATAPFVSSDMLKEGFQRLTDEIFDTVFPVVPFSYPIWRGLEVTKRNSVQMLWPEYLNKRSQDLQEVFHDAGQWYWFNVSKLFDKKRLFTDNTGFVKLSETEVQDIDNESDWKIAELKYRLSREI